MQCNKSFCGNGFPNGSYYNSSYNCNAPLPCPQNMYPGIVGEGEVTSMMLPDGTVQFFFMPTVKWWSGSANTTCGNPNYHMQYPHCPNSLETWLVRNISNPLQQSIFNVQCQRNDSPKSHFSSEYNLNYNNGFQLKFHNDNWTSTTDLPYFCPKLRQREYWFTPPCPGPATVQFDMRPVPNNIRHFEYMCSKPCHCFNTGAKPMSLESLVEPKPTTKSASDSTDDCMLNLDTCCNKKGLKRGREDNKKYPKVICACESTPKITTADKSLSTVKDVACGCTPADGRETQTCELEKPSPCIITVLNKCPSEKMLPRIISKPKCQVIAPELWKPTTSFSKRAMQTRSSEKLLYLRGTDCCCDSSGGE